MAISNWGLLKTYLPSSSLWLQLNPTFIIYKITSQLIHQIFSFSPLKTSGPNESTRDRDWIELSAGETAIKRVAIRSGLYPQNFEQSSTLISSSALPNLNSFEEIFNHVHKTMFNREQHQANIASGKLALQKGFYSQAKEFFAASLIAAQGADLSCEREAAICLADAYLQQALEVKGEAGKKN